MRANKAAAVAMFVTADHRATDAIKATSALFIPYWVASDKLGEAPIMRALVEAAQTIRDEALELEHEAFQLLLKHGHNPLTESLVDHNGILILALDSGEDEEDQYVPRLGWDSI